MRMTAAEEMGMAWQWQETNFLATTPIPETLEVLV